MMLLSCSYDVKLHDCNTLELVNTYRPSTTTDFIKNVSWCKDGSWLVLVPNKGNPEIIRVKENVKLLHSIRGVAQPVTAIFQRTTKKTVAISTYNGSVVLYDVKACKVKKQFTNSGATVPLLSWNSKDTHLATGTADGQIIVYSNTTNQKSNTFRVPNSKSVSALRFHPITRPLLSAASDEGFVAVWDINIAKRKFLLKSHQAPITDLVFSTRNHNLLVSAALDRTFQFYDTNIEKPALNVLTDHPLSALDLAPDGQKLAVGTTRGNICIYDLRELKNPLKTITAHAGEVRNIFYQLSTNGAGDSEAFVHETSSKTEISPTSSPTSAAFSDLGDSIPEIHVQLNDQVDRSRKNRLSSTDSFLAQFDELCSTGGTSATKVITPQKHSNSKLQNGAQLEIEAGKCNDLKSQLNLKPSSTPKENRVSFAKNQDVSHENLSSVLGASSTPQFNVNELRHIVKEVLTDNVKDVVREVVKDVVKEVVKDIVEPIVKQTDQDLRRDLHNSFLNIQWILSTITVYQNRTLNVQKEPTNSDLQSELTQLQEENIFLREKINELLKKNAK